MKASETLYRETTQAAIVVAPSLSADTMSINALPDE
jgi:hypothetical protein